MALSAGTRIGVAGASVVGVAFGMARYAYGLTLPEIRQDLSLPEVLIGLMASATFAGYLAGLLLAGPLAARYGSRAPTTVGGVCGALGALVVAVASSPWLLATGVILAGSASGWVWAPYSDIVTRVVPRQWQARTLATITTGTSGGLILLGGLAVLSAVGPWRLVWVCIALGAVAAGLLNLRLVPRTSAPAREDAHGGLRSLLRALWVPAAYSVIYFVPVTVYFTYAADVVERGDLPPAAVPVLYAVVGLSGMTGLLTGSLARRLGSVRVAALSLVAVAASLGLLTVAGNSFVATAASACFFGVGYMVGSAVLAVWTAQLVPERTSAAFTVCLVVGGLSSVATPALAGAVLPDLGTVALLVLSAALAVLTGAALLWYGSRRTAVGNRA